MMEVHTLGRSVVWAGERERAEHYTHQLQGHQLQATLEKTG
jgi:ATP-dependent Clp protease adaptor protein ClpS